MASVARTTLRKVTARVFGAAPGQGGNPVTIFWNQRFTKDGTSDSNISMKMQKSLSQSCDWESVWIESESNNDNHKLSFYVPSGESISFCAHAAIGAAFLIHKSSNPTNVNNGTNVVSFCTLEDDKDEPAKTGSSSSTTSRPVATNRITNHSAHILDDGSTCFLHLDRTPYMESSLPLVNAESLLGQLSIDMIHCSGLPKTVGIAGRIKTIIRLPLQVLQHKVASRPIHDKAFAMNCFMAQDSTGLYLYAPCDDNRSTTENDDNDHNAETNASFECRQFPKASGYPEDPATGIAAAALAVHLYRQSPSTYSHSSMTMFQGTAMGRPSKIMIQNIQDHPEDGTVSLKCGGRVEIDSDEEISV